MSSTFTPQKLIDNLNKNFPTIVGHAIIGYYEFYKMEQLLSISIRKNTLSTTVNPGDKEKIMSFLIAYANIIQFGKSYFLNEITVNLQEMENLTMYVNVISQILSQTPPKIEKYDEFEELKDGQYGGQPQVFKLIFSFITILLLSTIGNSTAVANSIALSGQYVGVSINIDTGDIPKAKSAIEGALDPRNITQLEEMTKEFGRNIVFPYDNITSSQNLTSIYGSEFVEKIRSTQDLWSKVQTLFVNEQVYSMFYSNITRQVDYVNSLVDNIHPILEEMCRGFVGTTDTLLPIPLYDIFNSKMASKIETLKENRNLLKVKKEEELKRQKLEELQITAPEPGLYDVAKDSAKTCRSNIPSISGLFSWPTAITTEVTETDGPTVAELQQIYTDVDESVSKEIQELGASFDQKAFVDLANEFISQIDQQNTESLQITNLQIYLSTICKIKKPRYIFNQTSGEVYLQNPARSRFHLMVLAKNVVSYYNTVIKGIQSIDDNGEIVINIPDEVRIKNLNSLLEKAKSIIPILVNYDTELVSTLSEGHESASNINQFFKTITEMWINIKNPIIQATEQFPVTTKKTQMELKRSEEEADRLVEELKRKHVIEVQERLLSLKQNNELNNVTKEEWDTFNSWLGINVEQGLKTGTITLDSIVNSTSQVGQNVLANTDILLDSGIASILSIAWGIAKLGMLLLIPALGVISIRSGFIGAIFRNAAKRLDPTVPQTTVPQTTVQPPTLQPLTLQLPTVQPPTLQPPSLRRSPRGHTGSSPVNYNGLTVNITAEDWRLLADDLANAPNGGRRYNRKKLNRKTRKNKKKKTRNKKAGKLRQTKHRNVRSSKKQ